MVVVFDIGNVLLRWNPRNLFRKVFADEDEMEAFLAKACAMDWIVETDRARSFQPALDARIAAYPQYARELRMFDELWIETLGGPIHENVELLERLRLQGQRLYSITNFCDEKFEIARATASVPRFIRRDHRLRPGRISQNPIRAFSNCS